MQKITNSVYFKTNFMEPIIVSGKTLGLKLLSAYDLLVFVKRYTRLTKFLKIRKLSFQIHKTILEEAALISMCLYKSESQKMFPDAITVLKVLTLSEIRYIYNEYVKLYTKINFNDNKIRSILEKVKNNYRKASNVASK